MGKCFDVIHMHRATHFLSCTINKVPRKSTRLELDGEKSAHSMDVGEAFELLEFLVTPELYR
jgi:hypothetical protein